MAGDERRGDCRQAHTGGERELRGSTHPPTCSEPPPAGCLSIELHVCHRRAHIGARAALKPAAEHVTTSALAPMVGLGSRGVRGGRRRPGPRRRRRDHRLLGP